MIETHNFNIKDRQKMNYCIICRKSFTNENPATKEHIIPYAIGGSYVINTICKKCNSNMGTKIDAPFIQNIISRLHIEDNQISGRNGKANFPFKGDYQDESGKKYRIDNIECSPKLLDDRPQVVIKELDSEHFEVSILFEKYGEITEEERINLLNKHKKYLKSQFVKYNLVFDFESIVKSKFEKDISSTPFKLTKKEVIDFNPFFLEALKIAYEFFVTDYPQYLEREDIKNIAGVLENIDHIRVKEYVSIHLSDEMVNKNLYKSLKENLGSIFIVTPLITPSKGTGYFISLYERFIFLVTLSEDALLDSNATPYIYSLEHKETFKALRY